MSAVTAPAASIATSTDSRVWRYVVDDGVDAAAGLAVDEALMAGCARDLPVRRPTLRLYTYRSHCALVGRYQTLAAEVDLAACEHTGTQVSRRPTGGGAIVMGRDQLGVALVLPAPATPPRQLLQELAVGVVAGLGKLGLAASFGGKNDLLIGGRKIAGLGLYLDDRGALLFHASVLADLDIPFMLQVLKIPAAKLADAGVAAVSERVTTVSRATGRPVSTDALRRAVAEGFVETLGVTLSPGALTAGEGAAAERLRDTRYADPAWLHEQGAQPDGTGSAVFRSTDGLVRVFVAAQGRLVKSVLFTGDFNVVPESLHRLEAALRWQRLDPAAVTRAVAAAGGDAPAWRSQPDVVQAVLQAGERAVERLAAAPYRPSGSCYFPDRDGSDHTSNGATP